jgi:hypothetical protein
MVMVTLVKLVGVPLMVIELDVPDGVIFMPAGRAWDRV